MMIFENDCNSFSQWVSLKEALFKSFENQWKPNSNWRYYSKRASL